MAAGAAEATSVSRRAVSADTPSLRDVPGDGDDLVAQLEYAQAQGFRAWEDGGMPGRSVEEQERLGKAMRRLGIEMGVFVAEADFGARTFVRRDAATTSRLEAKMQAAIDVAARCGARWMTVVPGRYGQRRPGTSRPRT